MSAILLYEARSGVGVYVACVFFFQAEDGIRDLVRSRGLGDVYKRQAPQRADRILTAAARSELESAFELIDLEDDRDPGAVSYTHLTLPTSDLV